MRTRNRVQVIILLAGMSLIVVNGCKKEDDPNTNPDPIFVTGSFTDARDNNVYKTVTIGSQTWMAENLRYEVQDSWFYNNDSAKYAVYGRLYTWGSFMMGSYSSSAVPSGVRGVCPKGWHVPSDAEWTILLDYLGGASVAGYTMKTDTGWANDGNGSNASGFTAHPSGNYNGSFNALGNNAYFWSSTEYSATLSKARVLSNSMSVIRFGSNKTLGFSCRCLKD